MDISHNFFDAEVYSYSTVIYTLTKLYISGAIKCRLKKEHSAATQPIHVRESFNKFQDCKHTVAVENQNYYEVARSLLYITYHGVINDVTL